MDLGGGICEFEDDDRGGEIAKVEHAGDILYTVDAGVIKYWLQSEEEGIC